MFSGFLHAYHGIDIIALPCFWIFEHRHETLVLVYVTHLLIAYPALPAFRFMLFFYTDLTLFTEYHS